jgi:hypothetical protein
MNTPTVESIRSFLDGIVREDSLAARLARGEDLPCLRLTAACKRCALRLQPYDGPRNVELMSLLRAEHARRLRCHAAH